MKHPTRLYAMAAVLLTWSLRTSAADLPPPPPGPEPADAALGRESPAPTSDLHRLRLIVETDAGGDPDDEQSLVRFLLYANEWDVQGLIANRPRARDGENQNPERTGLGIVQRQIRAYGECYPNLVKHDARYPTPEDLLQRTVSGYADSDAGVLLILAAVDSPDPRPVWFMNWGTDDGSAPSSLKRALDRVLKERGPAGYAAFKSRLRLSGDDQFGEHTSAIAPPFPLWVDTLRPELEGQRWYHSFAALTATAGGFDLERDVLTGHGPLGALYPTNTGPGQKEGDTMMFLYLVPTGMNDPEQPTWGSWAGRYGPRDDAADKPYYWANQKDTWQGTTQRENTLQRWATHLQNDFRARLNWCVADVGSANHPPLPRLKGALRRRVAPGTEVVLDASDSTDPDGTELRYEWMLYPEAGSYRGPTPALLNPATARASFVAPKVDAAQTIHLVLALTDEGAPPLTRYARLIVAVEPESTAEAPARAGTDAALDEYVQRPDPAYQWRLEKSIEGTPLQTQVIRLTSQTWRTEKDLDRPLWEHWLIVVKPETLTSNTALLMVSGGGNDRGAPEGPSAVAAQIAAATGSIVADLKQVPNQPLTFHGDGQPRKEDDLIGYCWDQYLQTGDATWLPRLPMTKSVVRAMDCLQEWSAQGGTRIEKFVIAGASKRGWTTWMAGAADRRVVAIIPMVIDVLNIEPSMRHHAETYGLWTEAVGNYYQHRIFQRPDHPRLKDLYRIEDPYFYRERLTMPKYVVNGSGDQFFCPTSSQFYWDELPGEKLLRYVPNADHGLKTPDVIPSVIAFYQMILDDRPRPRVTWSFAADGAIRAQCAPAPQRALLWQAHNPKARDFRLRTIGKAFTSTELKAEPDGSWVGHLNPPKEGWTAYFIEFTFDSGGTFPLQTSTAVRVLPETLPYQGVDLRQVPLEPDGQKQEAK